MSEHTSCEALSEASSFCAELDTVRELQCRIQELEAEVREWKMAAGAEAEAVDRVDAEVERLRRDNAMLRQQASSPRAVTL